MVPFDDRVTVADNAGRALMDEAPDSDAVRAISALADTILTRCGVASPHAPD
ncbi:MAG: hypothetical protein KY468_16200 [Armatimonadetes bacterium]|nr:hypothetical protein [Armatimonadota bacterium]